jgi:glycogen debranching enzyme
MNPISFRYFIDLSKDEEDLSEFKESIMYTSHNKYIAAHPGWVMGGSALDDFAAPTSFAYLRREVIAWGDSVKLRYGQRPQDAPFLWSHMLEYIKLTARYSIQ